MMSKSNLWKTIGNDGWTQAMLVPNGMIIKHDYLEEFDTSSVCSESMVFIPGSFAETKAWIDDRARECEEEIESSKE